MQGPFTRELNVAVMRQFHIAYMVTGMAARRAAFAEKRRPPPSGCTADRAAPPEEQGETAETILQRCRGFWKITLVGMGSGTPAA